MVADHELCIGIDGGPSPNIAYAEPALHFRRNILFLGVAEGPYLIALDPLRFDQGDVPVVEALADRTDFLRSLITVPLAAPGKPDAVALY